MTPAISSDESTRINVPMRSGFPHHLALDLSEVGASLVGWAQGEVVFVWHAR
jgi:hypothetical protein